MIADVLLWESKRKIRLSQTGILELCSPVYDPEVLENPEEVSTSDRTLWVAAPGISIDKHHGDGAKALV